MGTAVDILLRAPAVPANDVAAWRPNPPGTNVNLWARKPFAAPNDVVGYPTSPFAFPSFSEDADPVSNIVSVGTVGSDQSAVSSTSYTFTTTTTIPAGNIGILINVADNLSTIDGTTFNEHTNVTGGVGVWTKQGEYVNSGGGAASGATVSVWTFRATANNPIGTVFSLAYSSSVTEKAATMWQVSVTGTSSLILDPQPATNPISNEVNAAADFGSVTFSGLTSKQRLWFRGLGKELNSATAITPSAGFTITGRTRSSNTASAVIVRAEFLISTSTGETSNPTLAGAGDSAGLFLALIESITAQVNQTFGSMTSTAAGTVDVFAVVNDTFDAMTLTGAGTAASSTVTGILNATFDAMTLTGAVEVDASDAGSVFFWGPEMADGGTPTDAADLEILETLSLAMIDIDYTGETTIAPSGTGRTFATTTMRGVQVHIQIDLGNDIEVAESLMAMVSFARRGGLVGFALDRSFAFLAQITTTPPARGDTTFDYPSNVLSSWGGTAPAAGWRLYMASALPQMRREIVKVASRLGTTITPVDPIVFNYDLEDGFVVVRHKYFFPFLRYISGDVIVSEPVGGVYRFDAMFEEDVGQEQLFLNQEAQLYAPFSDMTLTGQGTVGIQGQLNDTFGGMTITGNGTTVNGSGFLNDTFGAMTLTGTGTVADNVVLNKTFGAMTLTGQGTVAIQGSLNKTFGAMTVTTAGHTTNQAALSSQFDGITLTSTGTVN